MSNGEADHLNVELLSNDSSLDEPIFASDGFSDTLEEETGSGHKVHIRIT